MIGTDGFVTSLTSSGVGLFVGVPDSLLKSFCAFVTDNLGDRHVIAAHDSVGGQPTVGAEIDLEAIARACGYNSAGGPVFRMVKVAKGARADLGRPKERPQENKRLFMETLRNG